MIITYSEIARNGRLIAMSALAKRAANEQKTADIFTLPTAAQRAVTGRALHTRHSQQSHAMPLAA